MCVRESLYVCMCVGERERAREREREWDLEIGSRGIDRLLLSIQW